jgi:dipeptidyl aminopeptidase/acylaminoacyl peptidase
LSAAFSPDGRRVVTSSPDGTARFWDSATGARAGKPLVGHADEVAIATFSPDGRRVVTASSDMTARIWDAATGAPVGDPLVGHEHRVVSAAFSPDGRRVVTASWDGTARIWDAPPNLVGDELRAEAIRRRPRDFTDDERRLYGLGKAPVRKDLFQARLYPLVMKVAKLPSIEFEAWIHKVFPEGEPLSQEPENRAQRLLRLTRAALGKPGADE